MAPLALPLISFKYPDLLDLDFLGRVSPFFLSLLDSYGSTALLNPLVVSYICQDSYRVAVGIRLFSF